MGDCKHERVVTVGDAYGYTGPVAAPGFEDPRAHGAIVVRQRCEDCGCQRRANQNGAYEETGPWQPGPERPDCDHETIVQAGGPFPFVGPVNQDEIQNRAAHGHIEIRQRCEDCGWERRANQNGLDEEHSNWRRWPK